MEDADNAFAVVARVTRGGHTESWHFGAAAVATPEGEPVARVGDPELALFLRSAAKPFQAMPLLLAGGVERFGLSDAELALVCASHAGTPAHVEAVAALLARSGFAAGDLACGAHAPYDLAARAALEAAGEAPGPLHNNCSGKHAGMLMACAALELPTSGYLEPDHPLQRRVLAELARFCRLDEEEIGLAVDGCSAPTFLAPLSAAARGYAALADPAAAGLDAERQAAAGRVVLAMTGEPEMVAGPGRFTTRLMQATGGRVLGKEGADGYYALAVRGPVAMGAALKIADGSERCRDGVVLDLLRQLGALSAGELAALASFHHQPVRSHAGAVVGALETDLELV